MKALVLTAALILSATTANAQTGAMCGERMEVMKQLETKYSERPESMGLTSTGAVVEILTSANGSWTILITTPSGTACLLAAGDYWEPAIKAKKTSGGGA